MQRRRGATAAPIILFLLFIQKRLIWFSPPVQTFSFLPVEFLEKMSNSIQFITNYCLERIRHDNNRIIEKFPESAEVFKRNTYICTRKTNCSKLRQGGERLSRVFAHQGDHFGRIHLGKAGDGEQGSDVERRHPLQHADRRHDAHQRRHAVRVGLLEL